MSNLHATMQCFQHGHLAKNRCEDFRRKNTGSVTNHLLNLGFAVLLWPTGKGRQTAADEIYYTRRMNSCMYVSDLFLLEIQFLSTQANIQVLDDSTQEKAAFSRNLVKGIAY